MWDCLHVEDSLSLYVDGLLTAPDRQAMEAHLQSCSSCVDCLESVLDARNEMRSLPGIRVPERLFSKLLGASGLVGESCTSIEDRLAALAGGDVNPSERDLLLTHIAACESCRGLHGAIVHGLSWARTFPAHDAPASLMARILDETAPPLQVTVELPARETWIDTLSLVARWLMEPRTAMMALTSVLVMGWVFSVAGVRPDFRSLSDPAAIFDSVRWVADEVYDEGVRLYYSVPHAVVGEVQARIERLREESL